MSESALRIAMICLGRYSGGSPLSLHLARGLSSSNVVRAFVANEAKNVAEWQSSQLDVEVHETYQSMTGAMTSILGRRFRGIADSVSAFAPDVVLSPFIHPWIWPLMRRIDAPWVHVVHDPTPHPGMTGSLLNGLDRRIIRRADHVVVHTASFIQVLAARFGTDARRVSFVPLGPLTDYRRATEGRTASPTGPRVLFFGRMAQYKGVDVLLDAAPRITRAIPGATISLVGSGISRRLASIAEATRGVHLHDRWVEDSEVASYFRNADLLVLPYTSATQSGVISVAAAFSLPVVASNVGGLAEQLDHGDSGVLVAPGDSDALARAVIDLWSDQARARTIGQALHDAYATRRSWPAIANGFADACRQAIRRRNEMPSSHAPIATAP